MQANSTNSGTQPRSQSPGEKESNHHDTRGTNKPHTESHANATLTPRTRLRLAKLIVEDDWAYAAAAKMFMVAPRTAKKWADRYRDEGPAGMADRSSRPSTSPNRTCPAMVRKIVRLRWRHRLGPVQITGRLGIAAATNTTIPAR